jgi:hypothetical protein
MALNIPAGHAQAVYRFSLLGDPDEMITTIGVAIVGSAQSEADALADNFIAAFTPNIISVGWTFLGVRLYVGPSSGPLVIVDAQRNFAGTSPTETLPTNCAYLITKGTARGGRQGRGRMFLPPIFVAEGSVDKNGVMPPATVTAVQDIVSAAFLGDFFVLLHDELSPLPIAPDPITSLTVQRQIATQRRRMRS